MANGRLNYVDVDRVVSKHYQTLDRQQLSSSTSQQRSNRFTDGLTLTLCRPTKPRQTTDVKTKRDKKADDFDHDDAGRNHQKQADAGGVSGTSTTLKSTTTNPGGRRTQRYLSCERTSSSSKARRMFSGESSSLSSDSEPDICAPCITKDATATAMMVCTRGCPANCSRHAGKTTAAKTADRRPLKTSNKDQHQEGTLARRSKSTRRALRQFFRVDSLFACRHGRSDASSSEKWPSRDDERQELGGGTDKTLRREIAGEVGPRSGGSESVACRGHCGRSATLSQCDQPAHVTARRARASRGSRTDATSRSVSPRARSHCRLRAAPDDRKTTSAAAPVIGGTCHSASRHQSTDRQTPTVDRLQVWNGVDESSSDWTRHGGGTAQRWNTLCVSPSDNSCILTESGCGFSSRRRVLATTPISPSTPAPDSHPHAATIGNIYFCCVLLLDYVGR